jgi:hypothetical protein
MMLQVEEADTNQHPALASPLAGACAAAWCSTVVEPPVKKRASCLLCCCTCPFFIFENS